MASTRPDALRELLGRWRQRFRGLHQLALSLRARGAGVQDYGIQVFTHGIAYHSDRRRRSRATREVIAEPERHGWKRERGKVRAFSRASQRRLEFVAANAGAVFRSLLTLTYHAPGKSWDDPERNGRVARRSKRDLNRFLSCLRHELGAYIWAREFQERGVVHYHVLCANEIAADRVTFAWCSAIDELGDGASLLHAAQTERPKAERSARHYLGRYLGKEKQKLLPPGIGTAGRWWGRSRSMALALLDQVVTAEWQSSELNPVAVRIVRGVRAYVSKRIGWKFRGGKFVNWGGALCEDVRRVMGGLREFYAGGRS